MENNTPDNKIKPETSKSSLARFGKFAINVAAVAALVAVAASTVASSENNSTFSL